MRALTATLLACFLLFAPAACVDFGIDDEQFICRSQIECSEGYSCLRGPSCYCVCQPNGTQATPGCEDPTCQTVNVQ
jgi:hypothetical protein